MVAYRFDQREIACLPGNALAILAVSGPYDLADSLAEGPTLIAQSGLALGSGRRDVLAHAFELFRLAPQRLLGHTVPRRPQRPELHLRRRSRGRLSRTERRRSERQNEKQCLQCHRPNIRRRT